MAQENITWNTTLYDQQHDFVAQYGKGLIEILAPKKGEHILDVGCGTGSLTAEIAQSGAQILGIDNSADMIQKARSTYPTVAFKVADIAQFETDTAYDAVFSNAVLHWVAEKEQAVRRMYACLKPNGRLVVEFGGKNNVGALIDAAKKAALHLTGKEMDSNFWFYPSIGQYATLLEKEGFRVVYATHYDRPTELKGDDGIKDWFLMFGELLFKGLTPAEKEAVIERAQEQLRPTLFKNGKWFADYKRIRVVAIKE